MGSARGAMVSGVPVFPTTRGAVCALVGKRTEAETSGFSART
jgi:hypothetical protein